MSSLLSHQTSTIKFSLSNIFNLIYFGFEYTSNKQCFSRNASFDEKPMGPAMEAGEILDVL